MMFYGAKKTHVFGSAFPIIYGLVNMKKYSDVSIVDQSQNVCDVLYVIITFIT